jgi:hypothetical protein
MHTEKKQGGRRKGAGRKPKFKEKATMLHVLCPDSQIDELLKRIDKFLKPFYAKHN